MNVTPLLSVCPLATDKRRPLLIEVSVPPETGPYLVTSTNSCMWVERPFKTGMVRAAVRSVSPSDLFRLVVEKIVTASDDSDWGAVVSTFKDAEARMIEYDLPEFDILSPDTVDWLPVGVSHILVPVEREYLGTVFVSGGYAAAVVHNASRGISIVRA